MAANSSGTILRIKRRADEDPLESLGNVLASLFILNTIVLEAKRSREAASSVQESDESESKRYRFGVVTVGSFLR